MAEYDLFVLSALFMMVGVSVVTLLVSHKTFKQSHHSGSYSDLDSLYLEILKIGMEHHTFRDLAKTTTSVYGKVNYQISISVILGRIPSQNAVF